MAHDLCRVVDGELLSTCFLLYYNIGDVFIGLFCLLRYVGRLYVKSTGKPVDILKKLNELAGFDPDEEIELYEVCSSAIFGQILIYYVSRERLNFMPFAIASF